MKYWIILLICFVSCGFALNSAILPTSLSNSDTDTGMIATAVNELIYGKSIYATKHTDYDITGKSSNPLSPAWIKCSYPNTTSWGYNSIDTYTVFGASSPFGITTVNNSTFWITDDIYPDTIFYITANGTLLANYSLSISGIHYGITTVNGSEFWVSDSEYDGSNFRPYVRYYNSSFGLIQSYNLTSIIGIDKLDQSITTVNGNNFWISDPDNDKIWYFNNTFGLITSYNISAYSPYVSGIDTINGSEFWITDNIRGKIFKTNATFSNISEFTTMGFAGNKIYGLTTVNGVDFWIINNQNDLTDKIFHITDNTQSNYTIQNITFFWGHKDNTNWKLSTTDNYTGVVWSVNNNIQNITEYTVSTADKDENYTIINNLPTITNLNSGNFSIQFIGYDSNAGAEDDLMLDYCYYIVDYNISIISPIENKTIPFISISALESIDTIISFISISALSYINDDIFNYLWKKHILKERWDYENHL